MRIIYVLTASLAVASARSISHPGSDRELTVPGSTLSGTSFKDTLAGQLKDRFSQIIKRFMNRPSEVTEKPQFGPPTKEEKPDTAGKKGHGWDKLEEDHKEYVENILDKEPKDKATSMELNWLPDDEEAKPGVTAMCQDKDKNFHVWYGSNEEDGNMRFHAQNKDHSIAANGVTDRRKGLTLPFGKDVTRRDALKGVPKPSRPDPNKETPVSEEAPGVQMQREDYHITVELAPDDEATYEGWMWSSLVAKAKKQQDIYDEEYEEAKKNTPPGQTPPERKEVLITYYDNRTPEVKAEMEKNLREDVYKIYKGPVIKDWPAKGDEIWPMMYYFTPGISKAEYFDENNNLKPEYSNWSGSGNKVQKKIGKPRPIPTRGKSVNQPASKKIKTDIGDVANAPSGSKKRAIYTPRSAPPLIPLRRNIVDDIKNDTEHENDPMEVAKMDYEDLLYGYTATQNNVSTLIWPVVRDLMDSSNSKVIYDMALSIWAQLTNAPLMLSGPYHYGTTTFPDLEQEANDNKDLSDSERGEMLWLIDTLEVTYKQAWENATAAANQFQGLDLLNRLAERLNFQERSIVPPEVTELDLTAENIMAAFEPPEDRFITPEEYYKMWEDAEGSNGTTTDNGTSSGFYPSGTNSTNNTLQARGRRAVTLPTYA